MTPIFTRILRTDVCLTLGKSLLSGIAAADSCRVALVIRRITIAILAAFLAGALLAVPASSKGGPAVVAKKKAKKCKKGKKGKKRKRCKSGGSSGTGSGLPGQAIPSKPTPPNPPPPALQVLGLGLGASHVLAGTSTTGQVTVDNPAPAGGQLVDLQSDSARVSVPDSVVIAPGQNTANFAVDTTSGDPVTAILTASIGVSSANAHLTVVDRPSVSSVNLERQCFTFGGPFSSNRVTLDVPAPADTTVSLTSSDPDALGVPDNVIVPLGSTSAFFAVTPSLASPSVTVTAILSPSEVTDTASVSATDPDTNADGLVLSPESITAGGSSTGTVTLDCEAPDGGTVVDLTSSSPAAVSVPDTVTVPAGQLSVSFQVNTLGTTASGDYTITAESGTGTKNASLTVNNLGT
jgi:hypothetical protein